jgi:hypothetical protein
MFNYTTKLIAKLMYVALIGCAITSCSANMAYTGQNGPDMQIVMNEGTRHDVEIHLGSPYELTELSTGNYIALYDVQAKTESSFARAAGHGTLDLFTLGLWEVVGGPAEGYLGRRVVVTVEYDNEDNLVRLDSKQKDFI